ncbi:MAG TPA: ABC transporter ATP-binding protein [Xanthobacteraceae bacterium]|nr:ABC transporter ATP-binding protein [Xanthobacteraceae bacterium]
MSAAPEIEFEHVGKTFTRTGGRDPFEAVRDLSFSIARGELVAILGKTGCGKSTTFGLISGLIRPSRGRVCVQGHDPYGEFNWFRGKIGIVFQNDRLMPWRTAIENVALGMELNKVPERERRDIAAAWLQRLGLSGHENDYPHALSGGMRQRVSIARAFAGKPGLLLCDEPFSALDEHTGNALRREFRDLLRETGATSIFITHSIDEALQLGERLMVFERPARIAFETRLATGMGDAERGAVAGRIRQVLSGEIAA